MDDGTRQADTPATNWLAYVNLLEGRRAAYEQAQWQAPTLIVAAQAFLLAVLTDSSVSASARWVILLAGALASVAAVFALIRLRAREVLYSGAVAAACEEAGIPDPRPFGLPHKEAPASHRAGRLDRAMRAVGDSGLLRNVYLLWILALVAFIAADVVAILCTS